jgi:hypothetical protein
MSAAASAAGPKPRRSVEHTKVPSSVILNDMPVAHAKTIYDKLVANNAVKRGACVLANIKLRHGDYPRYILNDTDKSKLSAMVRGMIEKAGGKCRVFYHQLAWRAAGNELPDFASNQDLSHICRRGQVQNPDDKKITILASEIGFGCFNIGCLEITGHSENLERGDCKSIMRCSHCRLYFTNCPHEPRCGASRDLENGLKAQKEIKQMRIDFTDGTFEIQSFETTGSEQKSQSASDSE